MLRMSSLFSSLPIVFTLHAWPTRSSVSLPQRAHGEIASRKIIDHFGCDEVMVHVDGLDSLPNETSLLLQNETDLAVRA
jgi:hypothetical protein